MPDTKDKKPYSEFGEKLKLEREKRSFSQEMLAQKIGCDVRSLRRWERGERLPDFQNRIGLCNALEISTEDLDRLIRIPQVPQPVVEKQEIPPPILIPDPPQPQYRLFLIGGLVCLVLLVTAGTWLFISRTANSSASSQSNKAQLTLRYKYQIDTGKSLNDVEWSPQGTYLACASGDGTVRIISVADQMLHNAYHGHAGFLVNGVTWSPDGKFIASGGSDKTVRVWNALDGTDLFTYRDGTASIVTLAWSPDGKYIVEGNKNGVIHVIDTMTGKSVLEYTQHHLAVEWVAWSPDSQSIASGSDDGTVHVWEAQTGSTKFVYHGHGDVVYSVMWSHDGKRIASASADRTVQTWDALTGKDTIVYKDHTKAVKSVSWSPDDDQIASAGDDQTVQICTIKTAQCRTAYKHPTIIWVVGWSPDGKDLASSDYSGLLEIWHKK